MFQEQQLRRALTAREARRAKPGGPRAAVASVLRAGDGGIELLFIERARRAGDPWSGHMAFPGGRRKPGDPDSQATAERETKEEVGLDLSGAERVGRLNDLAGRRASGRISVAAHVYWLPGDRPALTPNYEVADTVWVTLEYLLDPARHVDYRYPLMPFKKFPGIEIARQRIIWGLTYRMLEDFFERLDQPFPVTV